MAQKDHFLTCECCGKDYFGYGWSKYCSQECQDKIHQVQNNLSAKARRIKSKVCKTCGIEFSTSSNAKHCEDCFHKLYYCECGELKRTPEATKCTKCLNTKTCEICGKSFISKSHKVVCCSTECKKKRKCELRKDREGRHTTCVECGSQMEKRQGLLLYCESCSKKRTTCPSCGGAKQSDHKHCNKCKKLSHRYYCKACGKECVGVVATFYCKDCYPKCKMCGKKVSTVHNECCSQSCAQKLKWTGDSKEKMYSHLSKMIQGVYNNGSESGPNKEWAEFFLENNIDFEREFRMENSGIKELSRGFVFWDFKIGNILIDINPTISHNVTIPYRPGSMPLEHNYHRNKALLAELNGFHPIQIFDRDNNDRVKNRLIGLIKTKKRIYAKTIKMVSGSDAAKFCEENHLQGSTTATVRYGLYKGDQLYVLTGWGYESERNVWTLKRLCSLSGYYVAYGANKLMQHFIKEHDPEIIYSFSDMTKHSGRVYDNLGFSMDGLTPVSYWWTEKRGDIVYWRRECQKKNIHRLQGFNGPGPYLKYSDHEFWSQSEKQIMENMGYVKVEDAGMRRHIRKKSF